MKIKDIDVSRIIYTDIERDGTLTRPNLTETLKFAKLVIRSFTGEKSGIKIGKMFFIVQKNVQKRNRLISFLS